MGCEVIRLDGPDAMVRVGGIDYRLSAGNARLGPAKLAVRPGSISIGQPGGQGVAGRVLHSAYLGGHVEYEVETEIGTLFIIDHMAETGLPPASDVTLGFRSRGIALIQA